MTVALAVSHCEVCQRRLVPTEEVGICFRCQQAGVKFARGWVRALRDAGHDYEDVDGIVWRPPETAALA